jgi:hypothetical protein
LPTKHKTSLVHPALVLSKPEKTEIRPRKKEDLFSLNPIRKPIPFFTPFSYTTKSIKLLSNSTK